MQELNSDTPMGEVMLNYSSALADWMIFGRKASDPSKNASRLHLALDILESRKMWRKCDPSTLKTIQYVFKV